MKTQVKYLIVINFCILLLSIFGVFLYKFQPHFFNFDDGPYYAKAFPGEIDTLPLQSRIRLTRLGKIIYMLESRLLTKQESVIILRKPNGEIIWKNIPIKVELGQKRVLGTIKLNQRYTRLRFDGGWEVNIKPSHQESGTLYISPFGNFRFFYHSW